MNRWDWINRVTSPEGPESTTVRYVLVVLILQFFNEEERYAWPKVETLMARTGHKSIRTVQEALGEAEATGWLRRDAKPGRVTHYFPTIPEDRDLLLDPAKSAGSSQQRVRGTPQKTPRDPAESADDLRKEPRKDSQKEEAAAGPFPCPECRGPMDKIPARKGADFYGCRDYDRRTRKGCPGKRELDGTDSTPKAEKAAPSLARPTREALKALEDAREKIADEAKDKSPSPLDMHSGRFGLRSVGDSKAMAERLLKGTA